MTVKQYPFFTFLLMTFLSCNYAKKMRYVESTPPKQIINTYFSDTTKDYIYKAKIDVSDNSFGGILIIKKITDSEHRVAFTTEFGNTIFDFTIFPDSYQVNSVFEQLNKKILINTLAADFQRLICEKYDVNKLFTTDKNNIYNTKSKRRQEYIFTSKSDSDFQEIIATKRGKEKTITTYKKVESGTPQDIEIKHFDFKINIHLYYIGK